MLEGGFFEKRQASSAEINPLKTPIRCHPVHICCHSGVSLARESQSKQLSQRSASGKRITIWLSADDIISGILSKQILSGTSGDDNMSGTFKTFFGTFTTSPFLKAFWHALSCPVIWHKNTYISGVPRPVWQPGRLPNLRAEKDSESNLVPWQ